MIASANDRQARLEALRGEMAALTAALAAAADGAAVEELSRRSGAVTGGVGKLQVMMDQIELGGLAADAVPAARARRKAINAAVEAELEPAAAAVRAAVVAARKRVS